MYIDVNNDSFIVYVVYKKIVYAAVVGLDLEAP